MEFVHILWWLLHGVPTVCPPRRDTWTRHNIWARHDQAPGKENEKRSQKAEEINAGYHYNHDGKDKRSLKSRNGKGQDSFVWKEHREEITYRKAQSKAIQLGNAVYLFMLVYNNNNVIYLV